MSKPLTNMQKLILYLEDEVKSLIEARDEEKNNHNWSKSYLSGIIAGHHMSIDAIKRKLYKDIKEKK